MGGNINKQWNTLFYDFSAPNKILKAYNANVYPETWTPLYGEGKSAITIAKILKKILF